jgi:hypothetical protein
MIFTCVIILKQLFSSASVNIDEIYLNEYSRIFTIHQLPFEQMRIKRTGLRTICPVLALDGQCLVTGVGQGLCTLLLHMEIKAL